MPDTKKREGVEGEQGMHLDGEKSRIADCVSLALVYEAGLIFAQNNKPRIGYSDGKYPDVNGRPNFKTGLRVSRLVDSVLRHILAFQMGEDVDPDSGFSHLGHIICNLSMIDYNIEHCDGMDDREDITERLEVLRG